MQSPPLVVWTGDDGRPPDQEAKLGMNSRDGLWKVVATSGALLCPWRHTMCTPGSSSLGMIPPKESSGPKDGCIVDFVRCCHTAPLFTFVCRYGR